MATLLATIILNAIDPINAVLIILIMIYAKKHTSLFILLLGISLGALDIWLNEINNGNIDSAVGHVLVTVVSAFVTYGIFTLVMKVRAYIFRKRGHTYKKDDDI